MELSSSINLLPKKKLMMIMMIMAVIVITTKTIMVIITFSSETLKLREASDRRRERTKVIVRQSEPS